MNAPVHLQGAVTGGFRVGGLRPQDVDGGPYKPPFGGCAIYPETPVMGTLYKALVLTFFTIDPCNLTCRLCLHRNGSLSYHRRPLHPMFTLKKAFNEMTKVVS